MAVTEEMLHDLVAGSHAEGTTQLAVAVAVEHDDRILLIAAYDDDFDGVWTLPSDLVLPGEDLADALHRMLAVTTGLEIALVTSYLGHHDRLLGRTVERTFVFTVTAADPERICRIGHVGHRWTTDPSSALDLLGPPAQPTAVPSRCGHLATTDGLPAALRTHAEGLPCLEAAVELLIGQRSWLRRPDFADLCIDAGTSLSHHRPSDTPGAAFVDWDAARTALDARQLPCSTGEARLLRIAASLAAGIPVDLQAALTGLDAANTQLVMQAMSHAAGHQR